MTTFLEKYKRQVNQIARDLADSGAFENRSELGEYEQKFLDAVLKRDLPDSDWPIVLFRLTRMLHQLHKRRVVVLVDEYDTPISCAAQHGYYAEVSLTRTLLHVAHSLVGK